MAVRVLHIIDNLKLGGAQTLTGQIIRHLSPQRFEGFLCPLRSAGGQIEFDTVVLRLGYSPYDPRKLSALSGLCREKKIDLLHTHLHKAAIAGLLIAGRLDIPVIVHEHGQAVCSGPQYSLYRFLLRRLQGRSSAIIAISRHIAKVLETDIGVEADRICLLPNASDFAGFDNSPELRRQARQRLGFGDADIVLGFSGRLTYVKGADIAINALRILLESSDRYRLLVIGSGSLRKRLERLAVRSGLAGKVRFAGFCSNVGQYMAAADIALVPSRQEPFGLVGLEWMRMRIPVVSSGTEGLGEYMSDRRTALLAASNTARQTAELAEELSGNKSLAAQIVENAFCATDSYRIDSYMEKLQRLYNSLLNG